MIIDGNHAFFNRLQHRIALLKQVGYFVRLKAEHNAFQRFYQAERAQRADQRGEGQRPVDNPAALVDNALDGVQRDAQRHDADLLMPGIINRHKYAQRRGQRAAVDGAVQLAAQRRRQIVADKMMADQLRLGM